MFLELSPHLPSWCVIKMELFVVLACHLPLQELEWNFRCVCDTNCLTKLLTSCFNKSSFRSPTKSFSFHKIIKKDKNSNIMFFSFQNSLLTPLSFPTSSQVPQKGEGNNFIFIFWFRWKIWTKKLFFVSKRTFSVHLDIYFLLLLLRQADWKLSCKICWRFLFEDLIPQINNSSFASRLATEARKVFI